MTVDQIKLLRDFNSKDDGTGNRLAGSIACIFNNEISYVDSKDYVIYDDDNQLVHAIRSNSENPIEQARFPFRITTGFYDNVQYMEALYNMSNFRKAVQGLLVDTGLINENQKNHILKWAESVRNHTIIPKQPGPYFKDTILPIGHPPVPEVRDDGLHYAAPTNLISYQIKIEEAMTPVIEASAMSPVKKVRNVYTVDIDRIDGIADEIKSIIEGFAPAEDLYMASFTDNDLAAIYNPNNEKTINEFTTRAESILNNIVPGVPKRTILYIEAYNARVEFVFYIKLAEPESSSDLINRVGTAVASFIEDTEFEHAVVTGSGTTVNATIDSTDIGADVDTVIEFLNSLGLETVTIKVGSESATLNIGDADSIESFKEGMISFMPTENGTDTTATVEGVSGAGNVVVYTLKVKYYNEADCAASVNGVLYNTLAEACAVGGEVTLRKDTEESFTIPAGVDVTIDLNGHTISNADGNTIVNNGNLVITGDGTIDNTTHQKAALYNAAGATATVLGGTLTRSGETGVDANTSGGNSYYVIQNFGELVIGEEGGENNISVIADGKYSSLIENGYYSTTGKDPETLPTAKLTIWGGTFSGGVNTIKNDEWGILEINGGTFINYAQHSLLNWHIAVINGGSFIAEDLPVVANGTWGTFSYGDLTIVDGTFESGTADCFKLVEGYASEDIKVHGGTFSSDPSTYVIAGYEVNEVDGKYVVVEMDVEGKIDAIIASIPEESGLTVTEDPETNNLYSIVTSTNGISESGIFDSIVSIDGVTSITVTDGTTEVVYNAGDNIEVFKAAVDALVPTVNDEEVTLTMTVTTE